jgi:transposase
MSSSRRGSNGGRRRQRRQFSVEFKQETVRLMQARKMEGLSLAEIARELDIPAEMLRRWATELGQWEGVREANQPKGNAEEELRRLQRENEVLRQERDFLKKATAFFAKESR